MFPSENRFAVLKKDGDEDDYSPIDHADLNASWSDQIDHAESMLNDGNNSTSNNPIINDVMLHFSKPKEQSLLDCTNLVAAEEVKLDLSLNNFISRTSSNSNA